MAAFVTPPAVEPNGWASGQGGAQGHPVPLGVVPTVGEDGGVLSWVPLVLVPTVGREQNPGLHCSATASAFRSPALTGALPGTAGRGVGAEGERQVLLGMWRSQ